MTHWADRTADALIAERPDVEVYTCASGISPSGSIHIGNVRDIATILFVGRALRDRGKRVRLIHSWDDYDRLRKIPRPKTAADAGLPSWLDVRAMLAALDRLETEGLPAVHERHRRAAEATLAGIAALGLEPWQADPAARAPIVTTVRIPSGAAGAALRDGALGGILSPGNGELRGRLLRVNHYGRAADPAAVADALGRLAAALDRPAPTA